MFHGMKIGTNVTEVNTEVRRAVKPPLRSKTRSGARSGAIYGSPPPPLDGDSEVRVLIKRPF